jgi:hypothetical protein
MTNLTIRPQPLGIFPLPASYLVLPAMDGAAAYQMDLLRGRAPSLVPGGLRFYQLALAGDREAALAALADLDTPEAAYNRFVLESDPATYARLRDRLEGDLALLLEVVAYTLGWRDAPPEPGGSTGEIRACALSARAAAALEREDYAAAALALEAAADAARPVSPLLAAHLIGDLVEVRRHLRGVDAELLDLGREALRLLADSGLADAHAQAALRLGMQLQEAAGERRALLLEASRCYQAALRVFTRDRAPELYALAQTNLALAYLAMPLTESSDQLRRGIAIQALREALTIYTRERHPAEWASAQLNLANALQHLPSANSQDHLAEAVELYEELLAARSPQSDPIGYARLLANQGNALAHLGIYDYARAKLREGAALFAASGDESSAATVAGLIEAIDQAAHESLVGHGTVSAPAV